MHHIDIIAKLISENIDDLDYNGPEEGQEFQNTYLYQIRYPTGKSDEKYGEVEAEEEFYVRIRDDNTLDLWIEYIDEGYHYENSGTLQYDPKTQECNWVAEDISMLSKSLASEILHDFEKMMQEFLRSGYYSDPPFIAIPDNQKTLARMVDINLVTADL